jgi:hypothetical protein
MGKTANLDQLRSESKARALKRSHSQAVSQSRALSARSVSRDRSVAGLRNVKVHFP